MFGRLFCVPFRRFSPVWLTVSQTLLFLHTGAASFPFPDHPRSGWRPAQKVSRTMSFHLQHPIAYANVGLDILR